MCHLAAGHNMRTCPINPSSAKYVGDANVPATKHSFVVDLGHECDPDERLDVDQRLVVAFPARGPRITDLRTRRGAIRSWRRGLGQINRVQGKWEPEWVGVDFVLYHDQALGDVGFSVLWDDDGEVIRHIIDFVRLPVKLAAAGDAAHAEPEAARVVG